MDSLAVTVALVAAVAAPLNWWSRVTGSTRLELLTKPLVTIALGILAIAVADDVSTAALVAGIIGFVLCLVGDIALLPAVDRFLIGLGSFAAGHLAFVVMFVSLGLDERWLGIMAGVLVLVLVATVGRRIVHGARQHQASLGVPVAVYLAVIGSMAIAGWSTGRLAAIVGSTAFVVSDAVLGWRMFVHERRWMAPTVMVTYHAALAGLALSLTAPSVALAEPTPDAPTTLEPAATAAVTTMRPATVTTVTTVTTTLATVTTTGGGSGTTSTTAAPGTTDAPGTNSTSPTSPTSPTGDSAPATPIALPTLDRAVDDLARRTPAVAVSVWRNGAIVHRRAAGLANDGSTVDGDTPFVLASVSKLFTSLTVSKLVKMGDIVLGDPLPWDAMGVDHHPGWDEVTVREVLDHMSGMPADRSGWFDGEGTCREQLEASMTAPPTSTRGSWRYSNGNYCALGLLIEHVTGMSLGDATQVLVFDPLAIEGPRLVEAGAPTDMAPHPEGIDRLEALGGAGAWIASSDAVATVLGSVRASDRVTMQYPAVMIDQYGWGHTGTVLDAVTCAWVLTDGTTIAALVAGRSPESGGGVCNAVLPALGTDLGLALGTPTRFPR